MILRYILAWLPMVLIAIANGTIRESTYGKQMSELRAHQISTLTGILLFGIYVGILMQIWQLESASQAFIIGLIWLLMTLAFEFLFGHYVAKHSWQRLFQDYDLRQGRVWLLILIWTAIAPLVFYYAMG